MSRAFLDVSLKTLLAATITTLAACNREPPTQAADVPPPTESTAAPVQATPYQRPTADQLYALVAPIALFPDNLVAQTLAASTHPDQVGDARQFIQDHRDLTGAALIDAADGQPWDPSVKSLVAFPAVLDQMANNGDWTDALGQAYANEPSDVMNAIQVMRSRAQAKGNLKSTAQQKVRVVEREAPVSQTQVFETDEIVGPPTQTIEIEPADPDVVYVPDYDPDVVYGEPVYSRVYETRYVERGPDYHDAVVAGVIGFGTGILVGELFAHHEHRDRTWGWDSWHTSWGGYRDGGRPTVVYDNHPYVVNRTVVNNRYVDRSVHIDNRHDFGNTYNRPGLPAPGQGPVPGPRPAFGPQGAGGPSRPVQPDYAHMQRPSFAPSALHATAPNAHPALPPPRPNAPNVAQGGRPFPGAPGQPGQQPVQPGRFADRERGGGHLPPQAQQAAATPAALGQPRPVAHAPQEPRGQMPPPRAQPQFVQHAPPMPRNDVPRFEQQARPHQEAERPQPPREQHFQPPRPQPQVQPERQFAAPRPQPQRFEPPREMAHNMPQPRPEAPRPQPQRPQPQEHHEQAHPAPPQHHDDHKKHDN
ncbi:DUF3300 domain-containing protein [Luteibacter sp. SG786]|uniref:DUF3300 domain-containing protein n=1 Tax=Luteibacter sp. SG786 TaxID=2587130 RepID=UPI001420E6D3|nr:DUF3300 domain-containing protein [Luteibacter sp. SG786]NII54679.1 hypothetical protein [Luteibacter sp. SG786]